MMTIHGVVAGSYTDAGRRPDAATETVCEGVMEERRVEKEMNERLSTTRVDQRIGRAAGAEEAASPSLNFE